MRLVRSRPARAVAVAIVAVVLAYVLSAVLPDYYVFLGTSAIVAAIALLGLGVVTGSAGMIALCELSFAAVGAWVVSELNIIHAPGDAILWILVGGVCAGLVGILVGLPALRLRGINLAVVTVGFAVAVDLTLNRLQFPGALTYVQVEPPALFSTDASFFFLSALFLIGSAVAVYIFQAGRIGSGWRSIAYSERGTAAAGASVSATKLSAFAVSATLGGISGGLVTVQVGQASVATFAPEQSLALYLLSIVTGSFLVDMAIFGGIMWVLIPQVLKALGISEDWALIIFGVTGIQAITSKSNLGEVIRSAIAKRKRSNPVVSATLGDDTGTAPAKLTARTPSPVPSGPPLLEVAGLSVNFGALKALDHVSLTVRQGSIMGLIGPNGAGKSTLIDALSGFLPNHSGTVTLGGTPLDHKSPTAIARLGLRRTFQQERVPPSLTVEAYIRFIARTKLSSGDIDQLLKFFECPPRETALAQVDVGTRRLVEVAAQLASRPRILLMDEPAAGLTHEEHIALGERLALVPGEFETSILLIEHDLDLVRSVSSEITVLNFGTVLAQGPQDEVLADAAVLTAYMGETELS